MNIINKIKKRKKAFTLVELIISIGILAFVVGTSYSLINSSSILVTRQVNATNAQNNIRTTVDWISKDLQAGEAFNSVLEDNILYSIKKGSNEVKYIREESGDIANSKVYKIIRKSNNDNFVLLENIPKEGFKIEKHENLYHVTIIIKDKLNKDKKTEFDVRNLVGVSNIMERVAAPTANPKSGTVDIGTAVTLNTATTEAIIYYTEDGSVPDKNSKQYINPIVVDNSMIIKAIAVKPGMMDSNISSFNYAIKQNSNYHGYITEVDFDRRPCGEITLKPTDYDGNMNFGSFNEVELNGRISLNVNSIGKELRYNTNELDKVNPPAKVANIIKAMYIDNVLDIGEEIQIKNNSEYEMLITIKLDDNTLCHMVIYAKCYTVISQKNKQKVEVMVENKHGKESYKNLNDANNIGDKYENLYINFEEI